MGSILERDRSERLVLEHVKELLALRLRRLQLEKHVRALLRQICIYPTGQTKISETGKDVECLQLSSLEQMQAEAAKRQSHCQMRDVPADSDLCSSLYFSISKSTSLVLDSIVSCAFKISSSG